MSNILAVSNPEDKKLIAKLAAIDPALFKLALSDTRYTEKDLKCDLNRLKLAMRTFRDPKQSDPDYFGA